eukprot:scaffold38702_cov30-Tisochrysis_lutea.AAC.1
MSELTSSEVGCFVNVHYVFGRSVEMRGIRVSRDEPDSNTATALASYEDEPDRASLGSRAGVSCPDAAGLSGMGIRGHSSTCTSSEEKRRRAPRASRIGTDRTPLRSAATGTVS